ncbi:MAG: class I SAM-dependent methyltransferase [Gammaproteobacteria bacterium]|nr:class I SAM-dependent methyltransferase [Gammaproteobacteria bacterium]
MQDANTPQTQESINKNISFFQNNLESYNKNIQSLDTYKAIRQAVDQSIPDIDHLLDIGNGGVFDYDTSLVKKITALDLFLDQLPDTFVHPKNVIFKTGSALEIPEKDESFDGVLMVMLIHHLTGDTVKSSMKNMQLAISEAHRVLKPNGKFILMESCIPPWFLHFEKLVYRLAGKFAARFLEHPMTLQYPKELIGDEIQKKFNHVDITEIPLGRWVLQFGFKVPSFITPVCPTLFIATK